jgi:hypothetical protein
MQRPDVRSMSPRFPIFRFETEVDHLMQRLPRLVELLLIVALCGVIALWITRVMHGISLAIPPVAVTADNGGNSRVEEVLASARLFGSRRPGVLSDNVRALGVIADESGRGSVIVSIDGQAPKVYRVGDTLDGRLVTAIHPEEIELESGGARQVFRLPPPRPSAAGLTVLGTGPGPVIDASGVQAPQVQSPPQQFNVPPQTPLNQSQINQPPAYNNAPRDAAAIQQQHTPLPDGRLPRRTYP